MSEERYRVFAYRGKLYRKTHLGNGIRAWNTYTDSFLIKTNVRIDLKTADNGVINLPPITFPAGMVGKRVNIRVEVEDDDVIPRKYKINLSNILEYVKGQTDILKYRNVARKLEMDYKNEFEVSLCPECNKMTKTLRDMRKYRCAECSGKKKESDMVRIRREELKIL